MDKLLTLGGAIGCRRSTWNDSEVNATIPFYQMLETFHEHARELPRLMKWAKISAIIDQMMLAAIDTDEAESRLLEKAEIEINRLLQAV